MNGKRPLSHAVSAALTRREFIAAAGTAAAATTLPLTVLAASAPVQPARQERLEDWTIDDMWGVYPRYAEPIGYGRRIEAPLVAANTVDASFAAV